MFSKVRLAVGQAWRASFGKHLLLTNCVSCGGFFVIGDAIQQKIEMTQNPGQKFDYKRTMRLAVVGLTQGPPHHFWYLYLDRWFPGRSKQVVIKKILADQAVAAPFFAITFIYGAGLLEGNSLRSCWNEFKNKFPTIYMFDWLIWPPTQGINFLYVPTQYRVLYVNGVTVLWDVFLSYIKHKPEDGGDIERENVIKNAAQL